MTNKQNELYQFIQNYIAQNGYSPTIKEMARGLQVSAVSTVHQHLLNLVKGGYVMKDGYRQGYIVCQRAKTLLGGEDATHT